MKLICDFWNTKAGYRHFDCAYIYFNEQHIGKAIRESIQESNGELKREDFFIVIFIRLI